MRRWMLLAVKLYPRTWRERYGEEFQALLEDVNPGWRELADVAGGALKMQITHGITPLKTIAALAVAGMVVAAAASFAVPRRYVSSAVVRIPPQAGSAQIEGIETEVLSRSNLTSLIAGPLDLYRGERRQMAIEDVVFEMRRDIQVRYMEAASPNGAPALAISFAYPDKEKAQAVVRKVATEIVSWNAMAKRNRDERWRAMWPSDPLPASQDFEILSMASLPEKPVSPNRFGFAACGLGAGLALGLLTALIMRWPKSGLRMAGFGVAGGALAFGLSLFCPMTYTSTTVLRLEPPSGVPERLVSAVSGGPAAQQFQRLAGEVFSTASLAKILQDPRFDLYPKERARKPLEEVAGIMRRNIAFRPMSSQTEPAGGPRAFSISFSYSNRRTARAVVQELTSRFIKQNVIDTMARMEERKNHEASKEAERGFGEYLDILDAPSLLPVAPNHSAIAEAGLALGLLFGALAPRLRRRIRAPRPA